ncbi:hypothetical protein [Serpentinicella alkaliphila]|uniref:Uncharacterized protein n=1 Tax=Serpentinicella alkaliphila TaxID=1734049 RepID=A0A4R2TNS4_9FIRM|nr:hypothetical protein [Serpentinicella alkaliphila]QUH26609.1 hypothetical protein HZR23_13335 [Serpentinicella alkaliphila]TCQ02925.1 hypothetical protein EDD79_101255 [Serpentinicella alkaliphila]
MKANITWNKKHKDQRILYHQNVTFPTLEINHILLIDKDMQEFAIGMKEGIIFVTSDVMYQKSLINKNDTFSFNCNIYI